VLTVCFSAALSPKPFLALDTADAVRSVPMVALISLSIAIVLFKPESSTTPLVEISLTSLIPFSLKSALATSGNAPAVETDINLYSKTLTIAAVGMLFVYERVCKASTYAVARLAGLTFSAAACANVLGLMPNLYLASGLAVVLGFLSTRSSSWLAGLHRLASSLILTSFMIELACQLPWEASAFRAIYAIPFAAFLLWTSRNTGCVCDPSAATLESPSLLFQRWLPWQSEFSSVEYYGHCSVVGLCIGKLFSLWAIPVADSNCEYFEAMLQIIVRANTKLASIFTAARPLIGMKSDSRQLLSGMPTVLSQELRSGILNTVETTLLVFALMAIGSLVTATATKSKARRAAVRAKANTLPSTGMSTGCASSDASPSSSTSADIGMTPAIDHAFGSYGSQPPPASIDVFKLLSITPSIDPATAPVTGHSSPSSSALTNDAASPSSRSCVESDVNYDESEAVFHMDGVSVGIPFGGCDAQSLEPRPEIARVSGTQGCPPESLVAFLNGHVPPQDSFRSHSPVRHGDTIQTANTRIGKSGCQSRRPYGTSPQAKSTCKKRDAVHKPHQAEEVLANLHEQQMQLRQRIAAAVASSGSTSPLDSPNQTSDVSSPGLLSRDLTALRRQAKRAYSKAYRIQQKSQVSVLEEQLNETKMMLQAMYSAHVQLRIQHAQLVNSGGKNALVSSGDSACTSTGDDDNRPVAVSNDELRSRVEKLRREYQAQKEVADSRENLVRQLLTSIGSFDAAHTVDELVAAALARYTADSKFQWQSPQNAAAPNAPALVVLGG
jgi:hypothetical protein